MTPEEALVSFQRDDQIAISAAEHRMQASNVNYFPCYPGGQKAFDADCQTLAAAWLVARELKTVKQEVQS